MKKPVIIWVSALTLLTLSATLFAQTTTGSSLITQMKAATHAFTLAADLNPGATGLQSAPVWGKKTGDMLTAGEYNRILELVGQGGGGSSNTILNSPVTVDELTLLPTWKQVQSIDLSTKISIPSGSTHAILNIHCGVCSGNPGACNSPNNPESITVTRMDGKTMCRAYSGLLKSGSASIDSYNWDMDTNTTYIALENDGKTIKYNVEQNNNGDGEQGHVEILGFVTNGTSGGTGGGSGGAGKSGSLCGWVVDSSITGAGAGDTALVMCDGHNPRISCPSGYTKRDIMDIGAVAVTYYSRISTCVSNGGGGGTGGGGSGWVDVSSTTTPFDLNCEYKWKIPNFRSTGNAEVFSASRINLTDISVDFSAGNYQAVSASNKRSSTGDHGTFAAQTFQRCDGVGGGGGPIVKQISGSTPPKSSNYIALCNDNTTVPTMNGYGPLPVYWNSTSMKWIGRRIEIPTAGSGANVSGYMFDCPSLWIAE